MQQGLSCGDSPIMQHMVSNLNTNLTITMAVFNDYNESNLITYYWIMIFGEFG